MKKTSMILAGVLAVSFALPAMAGPNWTVIHEAEKNHKAAEQPHHNNNATEEEVLPLDHGPRAKTTPWMNKQREMELLAGAHKKKTSFIAYHNFSKMSHT